MDLHEGEFTSLPEPVYSEVLKRMDFDSLKALRLTSKTTKSWVETENILKRFNIHVYSSKFLYKELLKSQTKWSSFSFSIENPFKDTNSFFKTYQIKTLYLAASNLVSMEDYSISFPATNLLQFCPSLTSLSIQQLDIRNCTKDSLEKLIENWKGLERLEIGALQYLKSSSKQSGFFKNVCTSCSNLKVLLLPRTMYGEGETDEHHDRFIIDPTIQYLQDSGQSLKFLNIHRNDSRSDDKPSLRKLVQLCLEKNVVVFGKSSTIQKILEDAQEDDPPVAKIVGTLTSFNANFSILNFDNVRELRLEGENISLLNESYELPNFPKLSSIQLIFREKEWEENSKSYEIFIKKIMERRRDSVLNFSARAVSWIKMWPGSVFFKASDLVSNFYNIRELSLEGWMAEDDEFLQLWKGLPNLQSLLLQKCHNLTDRGFLGDDKTNPAILQLKKMRQLFLSDIPKLTDKFYKHAVSRMKLKYFFSSFTKRGFEKLKKGNFSKSIQYFTIPTMDDDTGIVWQVNQELFRDASIENYGFNSRSSCRKYFKSFKNLREPIIESSQAEQIRKIIESV